MPLPQQVRTTYWHGMTVSSLEAHLLALLLPQPCWDFLLVDADIWGCAAAVASVALQATARQASLASAFYSDEARRLELVSDP